MKGVVLMIVACVSVCGCTHVAYTGQVSEVRQLRGGMVIDLDGAYPNQAMTVYIPRNDEYKFTGLPSIGDTLAVKGQITQYRGRPEIFVSSPAQLER
jgi:hypothetical protein